MKSFRRVMLVVLLLASFALVIPQHSPAQAATSAFIKLYIVEITCGEKDGNPVIYHDVNYDMFLPAGYSRTWSNNNGGGFAEGPFATDKAVNGAKWNYFTSPIPYSEESYIYDRHGAAVFFAGYTVTCEGDVANVTITYSDLTTGGPGPDMVDIPSQAVVGAFVQTTPVYFAPRSDAGTTTTMEAGKTAWVYGIDATGQFYKVMLAGKFFWVPVSTMGPNYDEVWNGTPLPTTVVS